MENISLIIPLNDEIIDFSRFIFGLNEALSERKFIRRGRNIEYEVIIVAQNPENPSLKNIKNLSENFSIKLLIESKSKNVTQFYAKGFSYAKYDILVKVNPDQLFLTDSLLRIINEIKKDTDLVIISESEQKELFKTVNDQFLFKLQKDFQASTFVFTKYVWNTIHFDSNSEITFNIEFLHRTIQAGFIVKNFNFNSPKNKIQLSRLREFKNLLSTLVYVMLIRTERLSPQYLPSATEETMLNAGLGYRKHKFITHTKLPFKDSAVDSFIFKQVLFFVLIIEFIVLGLIINPLLITQIIVGIISFIYFIDIFFTFYLVVKTIRSSYEITYTDNELKEIKEENLPVYSILCPLYKETHMIPHFLDGIGKLDYPKEKLDVILLLEEDDKESIKAISYMNLPPFVRTIIVPHSLPKTKPKACNYGLSHVKGEYIVVYDAEDIPDPMQLKKAYIGFNKSDRKVVCLQAKLNYYNPTQNLLTRFFTAEYSLWFDVTLTGLQSINTSIPLGGTSNHFRTEDIKRLNAWDPFNVTEDADLGVRLFKQGYKTAVIDSVTLEEANSNVGNWLRQRSRWIKGYMQTYLVHSRDMVPFFRKWGIHALIFQLVIGGRIAFLFINPLLWIITISYFIFYGIVGPSIEAIYPPFILYMAIISLIFGNYLYIFCYILGCVKKGQWHLIKYVYLIPFYWFLMSLAGCMGFYQLIFKPHYWEKTVHGLHLKKI